MTLATFWLGALGAFTSAGALVDIFTRRLPNLLCAAMLVAGLALAFFQGGLVGLGLNGAHALSALVVGYLFFMAGVFGGGDGKFYAATASFFPLTKMLVLFVCITAVGLVLYVAWSVMGRLKRQRPAKDDDFGKLPYGVAIGGGALACAGLALL